MHEIGVVVGGCSERHPHHAGGQRVRRDVAAEETQQRGLVIQRHTVLVLASDDPRQRGFREQPARNDARRRWRDLDAEVAARAGVLDTLVLNDAHLLGNHVELLACLDTNLNEGMAVVRAESFRLG